VLALDGSGNVITSGALALQDLHSGGNDQQLHFSATAGGDRGFGQWNQQTLQLYVAEAMECSSQYVLSFTLTNGKDKSECSTISIDVDLAEFSIQPMHADGCALCLMGVKDPQFSTFRVEQSTARVRVASVLVWRLCMCVCACA